MVWWDAVRSFFEVYWSVLKPIIEILMSYVITWWTPAFLVLFFLVLAYALWPRNRATFDAAAKLPLRED